MQTIREATPQQINAALLSLETEILEQITELKNEVKQIKEKQNNEQ